MSIYVCQASLCILTVLTQSLFPFISSYVCLVVGVQIVSIALVACTRCPLGPPMSQLLCLMTQPRQPWRRPITWPAASVAGPPGMWEWPTNLLVGTEPIVDSWWKGKRESRCLCPCVLYIFVHFAFCSQWWMARARESPYSTGEFLPHDHFIILR